LLGMETYIRLKEATHEIEKLKKGLKGKSIELELNLNLQRKMKNDIQFLYEARSQIWQTKPQRYDQLEDEVCEQFGTDLGINLEGLIQRKQREIVE